MADLGLPTPAERSSTSAEDGWPTVYRNADTGKPYTPHHDDEAAFVAEDGPWRYGLAKGGEGGGKSVCGIVKNLERLRRGMDGIMGSPDLPHFKRSLWPEFRRWCPWHMVVESQRRRARPEWEPHEPFVLTFTNGAKLYCGGFEEPGAWEGPNVSFAHVDEARRKKDASILKVLDGRVRIPGPAGELPQLYITTTPKKHWLFEYFGPEQGNDTRAAFKRAAKVITLLTEQNAPNLAPGFPEARRQSLSEAEARVLLGAEWEDLDDVDRFLPSMILWDACRELLPLLDRRTPLVLAADAGVSKDSFGLVGVSRHPIRSHDVAVRLVRKWVPRDGQPLDFDQIEQEIVAICGAVNVRLIAYDPYQLHQMMTRLRNRRVVDTEPFSQQGERLIADKQLLDLIMARQVAHDGNAELRDHIANADRKANEDRTRLRLVKREDALKIDLAVALSMAAGRLMALPAGGGWQTNYMDDR